MHRRQQARSRWVLLLFLVLSAVIPSHHAVTLASAFSQPKPAMRQSVLQFVSKSRLTIGHDSSIFISRQSRMQRRSTTSLSLFRRASLMRGGELSDMVEFAYEWCMNLGNPAALVAGAVIATIYEALKSGSLDIDIVNDTRMIKIGKKFVRFLLLSAFALEVMSIFSTTVTGTMLLSRSLPEMAKTMTIDENTTPLSFLRDNFEFEFLTARLTFLQGLLNWILAIALDHYIPSTSNPPDSYSRRLMNKFIATCLICTMILMLAFYNGHMSSHYHNYGHMLWRWARVASSKFIFIWPPRPLAIVFVLTSIHAMRLGIKAICYDHEKITKGERKKRH